MKTKLIIVLALLLMLPVTFFSKTVSNPPTYLRVGSWNTMLRPWFSNEAMVIQTISRTRFDILALQGVWSEAAKDRILSDPAVRRMYNFQYYAPAIQRSAGIDLEDPVLNYLASNYIGCLTAYGVNTQQLVQPEKPVNRDCMYLKVGVMIHNYNPQNQIGLACLHNAMQGLPVEQANQALQICGSNSGGRYTHGGRPGLLILSRAPLENLQVVNYDTFETRRVMIYATVSGVRLGFTHFPSNVLTDIDSFLTPLQYGALQPRLAQDAIGVSPDVLVGTFNSGPDYQPEAHNLLVANGYRPLISGPTYCPAATHGTFFQCQGIAGPRSIDNIYVKQNSDNCRAETFAQEPVSDHIGIGASCLIRTN
jgi:hypothetical protein